MTEKNGDPIYFFICGAPKSGTTWLQRMLDAHPEIVCSGEGHFLRQIAGPLLQLLAAYNAHEERVNALVYPSGRFYRPASKADAIETTRFLVKRLMGQRATAATKAVGDKTPRYFETLDDLDRLFPACPVVHMVRDPRDVAASLLYHGVRSGVEDALEPGSTGRRKLVSLAASTWVSAQEKVADFTARHPDRVVSLRYEDLLQDAHPELSAVVRKLGVDARHDILDEMIEAASFQRLSGRAPGQQDPASFLRKGIAGDAANVLTEEETRAIEVRCGVAMRRLGYRLLGSLQ